MKELDAFSRKDIRMAQLIFKVMSDNNIPLDALNGEGGAEKPTTGETKNKPSSIDVLAPGESEITPGLFCWCGGSFVVEGLCGTQMAKESCVRIAICIECDTVVKIR